MDVLFDETKEMEPCLVCFDSTFLHVGITPCGHNTVCGYCHLRLRHLHNDRKCPICKTENEIIIVDQPGSTYANHPMWTSDYILETNYVSQANVGIFFPLVYYHDQVLPLLKLACNEEDCSYDLCETARERRRRRRNPSHASNCGSKSGLKQLQSHLKKHHHRKLCQLCVDHKRDFVSQLPRFSPKGLKNHVTRGDGKKSGFRGHPICHFCRPKRFYDITQLQQHLCKEHYECHLCVMSSNDSATTNRRKRYYRNYEALERHFDKGHFLCREEHCMALRFVVFENEADLRQHQLEDHNGNIHQNQRGTNETGVRNQDTNNSSGQNDDDDESVFQVWGTDDYKEFVSSEPKVSNKVSTLSRIGEGKSKQI